MNRDAYKIGHLNYIYHFVLATFLVHPTAMNTSKLAKCFPRRFDKIGFGNGSHSCCVEHDTLNTPKEKQNAVSSTSFKIVAMIIPW